MVSQRTEDKKELRKSAEGSGLLNEYPYVLDAIADGMADMRLDGADYAPVNSIYTEMKPLDDNDVYEISNFLAENAVHVEFAESRDYIRAMVRNTVKDILSDLDSGIKLETDVIPDPSDEDIDNILFSSMDDWKDLWRAQGESRKK